MTDTGSTDTPPTDTLLSAFESTARRVAEAADAATVAIGRGGRGSGVVVAPGKVLTNAHNLRDRTTLVTFGDGRAEQASVAGVDAHGDLVVLDVDTGATDPVAWADALPATGAVVFALARSLRGPRFSFGIVSGTDRGFRGPGGRPIAGSLEHTAPLARGSSGGPLLNAAGQLVGINTHRLGDGFYLALPADASVQSRVTRLSEGESPEPLSLGITITPAHVAQRMRRAVGLEPRDGLLIREVADGSPAARAGLRQGDLVAAAGDAAITRADDLFAVLAAHERSAPLTLGIVRGNDETNVTVSFAAPAKASPSSE